MAHHVGDGSAWEDHAADELADEVEAAVLVCDGHNDADGDEEDGGDGESEQETVPGEIDRVVFNDKDTNGEHCGERGKIPTDWCIFVAAHQTRVYVFTAHTGAEIWLCSRTTTVGTSWGLGSCHTGSQALVLHFAFFGAFCKRLLRLLPDIWAMPA